MKKALLCMAIVLGFSNLSAQTFGGGDGLSAETAWQISTSAHVKDLADRVNAGNTFSGKYFKQMNDISLTDYNPWTAIGTGSGFYFAGTYTGNNNKITDLTITSQGYLGACPRIVFLH